MDGLLHVGTVQVGSRLRAYSTAKSVHDHKADVFVVHANAH